MSDDFFEQLKGNLRAKIWSSEIVKADWTKKKIKLACLYNFHIVSQGDTMEEAIQDLTDMVASTLLANYEMNQTALQGIAPTPQRILDIPSERDVVIAPIATFRLWLNNPERRP